MSTLTWIDTEKPQINKEQPSQNENSTPSRVSKGCQTSPIRTPANSRSSSPEAPQPTKPATKVLSPKRPNKPCKPSKSQTLRHSSQKSTSEHNGTQSKYPPDSILSKIFMRILYTNDELPAQKTTYRVLVTPP